MELRNIRHFLLLAKTQHVSQTADLLNISQPSLSKSISSLEQDLGIKLFDRKGNHIYLNENGKQFYEYASQSISMLDNGILTARNARYDTAGTVTIANWVYAPIITQVISDYLKLNPLVNFNLCHSPQSHGIDPDLLVRSISTDASSEIDLDGFSWIAEPLFRERYVLVMHPNYMDLPEDMEELDISLMRDARFVLTFGDSPLIFQDITYDICRDAGFYPHVMCQVEDFISKVDLIASASAVSILPESCIPQASLVCPGLRVFHLKGDTRSRTIGLLRRKGTMMSEAAQDFWDFMLDYYRGR